MRQVIGMFFISVGLILIGIGTFDGFEKIGQDLISEHKKSYYDGLYLTAGDSIVVSSESDKVMNVLINDEMYEFTYNGEFYENEYSGFYIMFSNDELNLYKDGEKIRTLHKEKK